MPVFWLSEDYIGFPHPKLANEDGILAVGGDLSTERLLLAYRKGIFPWYNEGEPIIWWAPEPRFVLFPDDLRVSKSMRKVLRSKQFRVTFDTNFRNVITNCQQSKRKGQSGTWITSHMLEAYCTLHEMGYAHSVEVWENDELVGGLYGIYLGNCYYGESMFTKVSNASKAGFITLVQHLITQGVELIDCQSHTNHLESLGATHIHREDFLDFLAKNEKVETKVGKWTHFNSAI